MQSENSQERGQTGVNHPSGEEWMEYLYGESSAEQQLALRLHLSQCRQCERQFNEWHASARSLDAWELPVPKRGREQLSPSRLSFSSPTALKWAVAALVLLAAGFWLGRQTSANTREMAVLKNSVAELALLVQNERAVSLSNSVVAARVTAQSETLRLVSSYARVQEQQRSEDHQAIKAALGELDTRVGRLRTELETVAVNTEGALENTHQNLVRVASYSAGGK